MFAPCDCSSAVAQAGMCKSEELPLVTAVVTPRFVPSCTPTMLKVRQPACGWDTDKKFLAIV